MPELVHKSNMASRLLKDAGIGAVAGDGSMQETFTRIMRGEGDVNLAYPKYTDLRDACQRLVDALALARAGPLDGLPETRAQLDEYHRVMQQSMKDTFSAPDLEALQSPMEKSLADYSNLPKEPLAEFFRVMTAIQIDRQSLLVNLALITCKNLAAFKHHLADGATDLPTDSRALSDRFIIKMPGITWCPLASTATMPSINIKHLYITQPAGTNGLRTSEQQFWLYFLHKVYAITRQVYETYVRPDSDPESFVDIVEVTMSKVMNRPGLKNCREAFAQITRSANLMRQNFATYYRDFCVSGSPSHIIEQYIVDVSKMPVDDAAAPGAPADPKKSVKLVSQFRRIIAEFQKSSHEQGHNPVMQRILQHANRTSELVADSAATAVAAESAAAVAEIAKGIPAEELPKKGGRRKNRKSRSRQSTQDEVVSSTGGPTGSTPMVEPFGSAHEMANSILDEAFGPANSDEEEISG